MVSDLAMPSTSVCDTVCMSITHAYVCTYLYLDMVILTDYVFECTAAGDFTDVCDCSRFYKCNHNGATPVVVPCPAGTLYNGRICDWARNVNCVIVSIMGRSRYELAPFV